MDLVAVPAIEWQQMQQKLGQMAEKLEMVEDIYRLLKVKHSRKEWVRMTEFMVITGKERHEVDHICGIHTELKRRRQGEGVQINLKKYNELYQ